MKTVKVPKPHEALFQAFLRKRELQPTYSQRAFARDLGVSSVFVSKIFTGERSLPPQRVKQACKLLGMDPTEEAAFLRCLVLDAFPLKEIEGMLDSGGFAKMSRLQRVSSKKLGLLRHWHTIAILNLLTCQGVLTTPKALARRLSITEQDAAKSLLELEQEGLVSQRDGRWHKIQKDDIFPAAKSVQEIRSFHNQMIRKAQEALLNISPGEYERRLITGTTVAVNSEQLETVKKRVFEMLSELAEGLSAGECGEVYQMNFQLFPLTKKNN